MKLMIGQVAVNESGGLELRFAMVAASDTRHELHIAQNMEPTKRIANYIQFYYIINIRNSSSNIGDNDEDKVRDARSYRIANNDSTSVDIIVKFTMQT